MGMFDYFSTREVSAFPDMDWQTKNFDCLLETYSLRQDLKLYKGLDPVDYTGTVFIYNLSEDNEYIEYALTFFFGEFQSAHRNYKK
jgi:hypothetical protein